MNEPNYEKFWKEAKEQLALWKEKYEAMKQRCEAAELFSALYGEWQDLLNPDSDEMSKEALEAFQKWEAQLKIWQSLKQKQDAARI